MADPIFITTVNGKPPDAGDEVDYHNRHLMPPTVKAIYMGLTPEGQHEVVIDEECTMADLQGGETRAKKGEKMYAFSFQP